MSAARKVALIFLTSTKGMIWKFEPKWKYLLQKISFFHLPTEFEVKTVVYLEKNEFLSNILDMDKVRASGASLQHANHSGYPLKQQSV